MTTQFDGGPVLGGTFPALIWHDFMVAADEIGSERSRRLQPRRHSPSTEPRTGTARPPRRLLAQPPSTRRHDLRASTAAHTSRAGASTAQQPASSRRRARPEARARRPDTGEHPRRHPTP